MPLVISYKSRSVQSIPSEEVLAEILGHSNFDGEDWAVGDILVFEDGTQSHIELDPGGQFYVWASPRPADFLTVRNEIDQVLYNEPWRPRTLTNWPELFAAVKKYQDSRTQTTTAGRIVGCAIVLVLFFIAFAAPIALVWWLMLR